MQDTFGNTEMEMECLAGRVLCYEVFPAEMCHLAYYLSSLPNIHLPIIEIELAKLKKMLIDKEELVKDEALVSIYKGNMIEFVELLIPIIDVLEMTIAEKMIEKDFEVSEDFMNTFTGLSAMNDYSDIGLVMNAIPSVPFAAQELQKEIDIIKLFIDYATSALSLYGIGEGVRIPKTMLKVGTREQLLQNMYFRREEIAQSYFPTDIVYIVGSICDSILSLLTSNPLDPYFYDMAKELYHIASYPESYDAACKKGQVQQEVGDIFTNFYSAYSVESTKKFLKAQNHLTESERINYKEALGLCDDNGMLTSLCSNFVNRIYTQQS